MLLRRSLAVAALALLAAAAGPRPAPAAERTTVTLAHIRLSGDLSEAPVVSDPLFGTTQENFKSKIDRIKKAKGDATVGGLLLQVENLQIGWGKVHELRQAVADFRQSGKKAYAYLEDASTKDYVLAASCDEIFMPQSGTLMLTGIRLEVTFYKDLLDKLGVKADMLQMGAYKGAAEPFTRSSMSQDFRSQLEKVVDDYYDNSIVRQIADSRPAQKWSPDQVKKLIDAAPYTARAAKQAGLVDRISYVDGIPAQVKAELKADKVEISHNYAQAKADELKISGPFDILKLLNPVKGSPSSRPKIAVIYAGGLIVTGKGGDSLLADEVCGSATIIDAIRQAEKEPTVKAIVLRIDSPGGSALASDLICNELRRSKKPVLASMSDTAASGGYYIATGARKIYAEPGTLTGSIGVVGGKIALGGLFDKVGVHGETISRGANANILSEARPFTESERKAWGAVMRDIYDQFLDRVVEARHRAGKQITREELEKSLAGGRVWTGRQAKANGLVDELGTLQDAIAEAKKLGHIPADREPELLLLPEPKSFLDKLLDMKSETRAPALDVRRLPVLRQLPEVGRQVEAVEGLLQLRGEPVWLLAPCRVEVR
ncbi:MAG TPA: signal peptide peptidase SppA [Gemmataceae bacterium]|nr:signal peptide peptidase SppA [Gemmataceae bacterium]